LFGLQRPAAGAGQDQPGTRGEPDDRVALVGGQIRTRAARPGIADHDRIRVLAQGGMDLFEGRAAGDLDALVAKNLDEPPRPDGIVFAKKNSWLRAHANEVLGGSARIHGELRISTNVLPLVRGEV